MPYQGPDHDWYPDRAGHQPVRNRWKFFPERKAVSVIHVERCQQQNVREAHARNVQPDGALPPRRSAKKHRSERKRSENEQVVIVGPAHHGQKGRGRKYRGQTPIVDCPELRMAAAPFLAQHRHQAGDHASDPEKNVNPYERQEHRGDGGNLDPCYDGCFTRSHYVKLR